eukprot:scaffold3767_cov242-Prasinococcus_capsulatus_cf.AAC.2
MGDLEGGGAGDGDSTERSALLDRRAGADHEQRAMRIRRRGKAKEVKDTSQTTCCRCHRRCWPACSQAGPELALLRLRLSEQVVLDFLRRLLLAAVPVAVRLPRIWAGLSDLPIVRVLHRRLRLILVWSFAARPMGVDYQVGPPLPPSRVVRHARRRSAVLRRGDRRADGNWTQTPAIRKADILRK